MMVIRFKRDEADLVNMKGQGKGNAATKAHGKSI